MNIFYLHEDATAIPSVMYNKHVVKMILETAQLLCTAHQTYAEELGYDNTYIPYKKAYYNHPSAVWARENSANYDWLYLHFISLCDEYTTRYGKVHASYNKCAEALYNAPVGIPQSDTMSKMPQCMPDEYKAECSIQAYRNYYIQGKIHIANRDEFPIRGFQESDSKLEAIHNY